MIVPVELRTYDDIEVAGIFYGIGTILTGIFPYDSYLNNDFSKVASLAQHIHNLTGFLTYVFAPLSIFSIGLGLRKSSAEDKLANFSIISSLFAIFMVSFSA